MTRGEKIAFLIYALLCKEVHVSFAALFYTLFTEQKKKKKGVLNLVFSNITHRFFFFTKILLILQNERNGKNIKGNIFQVDQ